MNTYIIRKVGTNEPTSVKAKTKAEAIVKYMDKYYASFYGPHIIDSGFEIYSINGIKLSFMIYSINGIKLSFMIS